MSEIAIRVENLGKLYRIGSSPRGQKTLRDSMMAAFNKPMGLFRHPTSYENHDNMIWALRHLSFEVRNGEVIGVIGRNGAGKSTLLKILSRITEPTEGRAIFRGKVGSLLEVGTGFHSELTGRENIYLSGAILGMKWGEIKKKFDEIVAFSEIEKFIDTPVKHYSSGMYMRLAFGVAAHLDPEILLVDEVLAVGDNAFQTKCLTKMEDIARKGRTVLFVSHNMVMIKTLCGRAMLIDGGKIIKEGSAVEVVQAYQGKGSRIESRIVWEEHRCPKNRAIKLLSVSLKNTKGEYIEKFNVSEEALIEIAYRVIREGARAMFSVVVFDANGYCVFGSLSNAEENVYHSKPLRVGAYLTQCHLYRNLFNNGQYDVSVIGASEFWTDTFQAEHVISFDVMDDASLKKDYWGNFSGVVRPKLIWTTTPLPTEKNADL